MIFLARYFVSTLESFYGIQRDQLIRPFLKHQSMHELPFLDLLMKPICPLFFREDLKFPYSLLKSDRFDLWPSHLMEFCSLACLQAKDSTPKIDPMMAKYSPYQTKIIMALPMK